MRGEIKKGAFLFLIIVSIGVLFLFYNNVIALDTPTNITTASIQHLWLVNEPVNALIYDSTTNVVYFAGGGESSVNVFGLYNITSNTTEDLRAVDSGNWMSNIPITRLAYNTNNNLVYFVGQSGLFGLYNRTSNSTEDLRAVDSGDWIGANNLQDVTYASKNKLIYIIGASGILGAYNSTSNTTEDLRGTDTGNWIGTATIDGATYDSNELIYLGGTNSIFGFYNISTNITENLTETDSGDWFKYLSNTIYSVTYDSRNNLSYFVGGTGAFGIYNRTSNLTENLNATDTGNWIGTTDLFDLIYSSSDNLIYLVGQTGTFGVYNRTSNITEDLRGTDTGNWIGTSQLNGITYNLDNDSIFLGGNDGIFGVYNRTSNITEDLNLPNDWLRFKNIGALTFNPANNLLYFIASDAFGSYNKTLNIKQDLRDVDVGDWVGAATFQDLIYASNDNLVYLGGNNGLLGVYNISSNSSENLSDTDAGNWIGSNNKNVVGIIHDSDNNLVYFVGTVGLFGIYNRTSNLTENLNATDTGNWIGTTDLFDLIYSSSDNLIYLGGGAGKFGVYNRTSNITEDLTRTNSSMGIFTSLTTINSLGYDNSSNLIYLSILGGLAIYNRTSNLTENLNATDSGDWVGIGTPVDIATYNNLAYFVGASSLFGVYNLSSNVTENLNMTDSNDWMGANNLNAITYDTKSNLVYLAGDLGIFGVYNRTSNTTVIAASQQSTTTSSGGDSPAAPSSPGVTVTTSPGGVTQAIIPIINPGTPAVIEISSSYSSFISVQINSKTIIGNVSLTITPTNISDADFQVIAGGKKGEYYEAYKFNFTGDNKDIDNATIEFRVNKTWLDGSGFNTSNLALYRTPSNDSKWRALETTFLSNDTLYYYFSAVSTQGFSTFLIFIGEDECIPASKRCFENEVQFCLGNRKWLVSEVCDYKCVNGACVDKGLQVNLNPLVVYPIIGIVVVGVLISFLAQRMPERKKRKRR